MLIIAILCSLSVIRYGAAVDSLSVIYDDTAVDISESLSVIHDDTAVDNPVFTQLATGGQFSVKNILCSLSVIRYGAAVDNPDSLSVIHDDTAVDNPVFTQLATGGQFSVKNFNDVEVVSFTYTADGGEEQSVFSHNMHADGYWKFTVPGLKPKQHMIYHARLYFRTGASTTEKQEWRPASLMVLPPRRMRGAVIFRDDFNGKYLDQNHWIIDVTATGDYHNQFQTYTNDDRNVYLKNGNVYLMPTLAVDSGHFTNWDLYHGVMNVTKIWGVCTESGFNGCYRDSKNQLLPPTLSGRLRSIPTLRFGHLTVRAQIPRGDWLWPAIWLLSKDSVYGGHPGESGELDMMEATCNKVMYYNKTGDQYGIQRVTSSFHFGPQNADIAQHGQLFKKTGDWHGFHLYELEWTLDYIIFSVDGVTVNRIDIPDGSSVWDKFGFHGKNIWINGTKIAPFDQEFYLILNVAVGGDGIFDDNAHYAYKKPWINNSKTALKDFWEGRNLWLPTWQGDNVAMIIDYVEFRHL